MLVLKLGLAHTPASSYKIISMIVIIIAYFLIGRSPLVGSYYRKSTVYTMFATTALGLCALAIMTILDCRKHRKAKKKGCDTVIPPGVQNIQTGKEIELCSIITKTQ